MKRVKLRATLPQPLAGTLAKQAREASELVRPSVLEIEQDDGGYYLFCLDDAGQFLAHSWHETLDDAKALAQRTFAIPERGWSSVSR
jgi:hypothetical protein